MSEFQKTRFSVISKVISDNADRSERVQNIIENVTSYQNFIEGNYTLTPFERLAVVYHFFPNLQMEVVESRVINKTVPGGRVRRHRKFVIVGNGSGYLGTGVGKSVESSMAISKAVLAALINIRHIERGCGSFQCNCNTSHSIMTRRYGKSGSTVVEILPVGLGKGLIMNVTCRQICEFIGIKDLIINIFKPSNVYNTVTALLNAFSNSRFE